MGKTCKRCGGSGVYGAGVPGTYWICQECGMPAIVTGFADKARSCGEKYSGVRDMTGPEAPADNDSVTGVS